MLIAALLVLFSTPLGAQKVKKAYVVGFYNMENLFDPYHDEGKNDYQYLPDGPYEWNEGKYQRKIHNMARVIRAMADDNGRFHTILGISEVENRHVVDDLSNDPQIIDANYQIIHYDSPDSRGIDVAILYRPDQFKLIESEAIKFTFEDSDIQFSMDKEQQSFFRTRDIVMARGTIDGEMCAFFVAHLPSRLGDKGGDLRSRGAEIIHKRSLELMEEFPGIKIVVMGDMNDNPTDESQTVYLHGKARIEDVEEEGDFFSPFYEMFKAGYGSLAYAGEWNIYDIIQVSASLAKPQDGSLHIIPIVKERKNRYYGRVFSKPFMTNQDGADKGTPYRSFKAGGYIGGYADHYPTYIIIGK